MNRFMIFSLSILLVISSCQVGYLPGYYTRNYSTNEATGKSNNKEVLVLRSDFTYKWITYKNNTDSAVINGGYKYERGSLFLIPKDEVNNTTFCLLKKNNRLYFYNCANGKRERYSHPFLKQAGNNDNVSK